MYKKIIKETRKEYDNLGKVVKETIIETTEEMSEAAITAPTDFLPIPSYPYYPYISCDPVCVSSNTTTMVTQPDGKCKGHFLKTY